MSWRGRDPALELHSIDEFRSYLRSLNFQTGWRPSGIVQHNTASPTLYQWWHSVPPAERMDNLQHYYEVEQGWSAGPHAFVDGVSYWIMTDFNVSGVHSPSWNGTRLGIEMVGDYNTESDETSAVPAGGKQVMDMTIALFGECCMFFGWEPNGSIIKQHKEDPATDHDCPGRNVVKQEFLDDVAEYMGDGGDHNPNPPQPPATFDGVVYGIAANDHLNIRASSSSSAAMLGQADNNDIVHVVGEAMNGTTKWYRLKFGEGAGTGVEVFGWASAAYIRRQA